MENGRFMSIKNPWNDDVPMSYSEMWIRASVCSKNINKKVSGDEETTWLDYVINSHILPAIKRGEKNNSDWNVLLLGSNEGHMERALYDKGYRGNILASDIAEKALARAKERSVELGIDNIKYMAADLNNASFDEKFDFIIAEGVLHHVVNIKSCLTMLNDCLKENGKMFVVEFEGPFRFQLPEIQVRWINAALNVLPKSLRPFPKSSDIDQAMFPATLEENSQVYYVHPTEASIVDFDPSEAICGPELKELFPEVFNVDLRKGFGGTLLSYMTGHFDFKRSNNDEFTEQWLKILVDIEDTLIKQNILQDDFVFYVLSKRRGSQINIER